MRIHKVWIHRVWNITINSFVQSSLKISVLLVFICCRWHWCRDKWSRTARLKASVVESNSALSCSVWQHCLKQGCQRHRTPGVLWISVWTCSNCLIIQSSFICSSLLSSPSKYYITVLARSGPNILSFHSYKAQRNKGDEINGPDEWWDWRRLSLTRWPTLDTNRGFSGSMFRNPCVRK